MTKKLTILILCLSLIGCFYNKRKAEDQYYHYIFKWQERVKQEGWSKIFVDGVVDEYLSLWTIEFPEYSEWPTPRDAIKSGFKGSCTARASGLFGTMRILKCPYPIGIELLGTMFCHHACLVVDFGKGWQRYETIPGWTLLDRPFYKSLIIFNETSILS